MINHDKPVDGNVFPSFSDKPTLVEAVFSHGGAPAPPRSSISRKGRLAVHKALSR